MKVHYYNPIPDTRELSDKLWTKYSELVGVEINEERMTRLLELCSTKFKDEYESLPRFKTPHPHQYYIFNGSFEAVDGEVCYCIIRYFKPKRVFEVSSGNSTKLMAQALLKNKKEGYEGKLIVIDPYPDKIVMKGLPGLYKVIQAKVQDIPRTV